MTQSTYKTPSLARIFSLVEGAYLEDHFVPELDSICNEARELNRFDQYAFFSTLRQAGKEELSRRDGVSSDSRHWENDLSEAAWGLPTASLNQLAGHYRAICTMPSPTKLSQLIVEASRIIAGILDIEMERRTAAGWYSTSPAVA